jgi:hypothetical protein
LELHLAASSIVIEFDTRVFVDTADIIRNLEDWSLSADPNGRRFCAASVRFSLKQSRAPSHPSRHAGSPNQAPGKKTPPGGAGFSKSDGLLAGGEGIAVRMINSMVVNSVSPASMFFRPAPTPSPRWNAIRCCRESPRLRDPDGWKAGVVRQRRQLQCWRPRARVPG